MAEKERYNVIGVEVDGQPITDLWVKPGKEHVDATSGSLMLGNTQVATTTWGWKRGYDRAYVGTWLANQESAYVRRGLNGHALDYACKMALEQLHNDRVADSKQTAAKTTQMTIPMTQTNPIQQTILEIHSKICGNGAVAQVIVDGKYHEKTVDGVTQPQALLGAMVMGLRMATTNVLILTSDMWIVQRWGKAVRPDHLEKYWNKVYQLAQGKNIRFQFTGKGGQSVVQQKPEPPKPSIPQHQEEDIPPLDWEGILDYDSEEEVKPE